MKFGELFLYYFFWHYSKAIFNITQIFRNILWFLFNFFSIPLLIVTLFSPLERLHETYHGDFNIGEFAATIAVNVLMRIVGAALRLVVIILGLGAIAVTFVAGLSFYVVWILLPFLVPILFFGGLAISIT